MHMTPFATRVAAAAAALFVTTRAIAQGTFTPEIRNGRGSGQQIGLPGDRTTRTDNRGLRRRIGGPSVPVPVIGVRARDHGYTRRTGCPRE